MGDVERTESPIIFISYSNLPNFIKNYAELYVELVSKHLVRLAHLPDFFT